jgi:hypothetical protein
MFGTCTPAICLYFTGNPLYLIQTNIGQNDMCTLSRKESRYLLSNARPRSRYKGGFPV